MIRIPFTLNTTKVHWVICTVEKAHQGYHYLGISWKNGDNRSLLKASSIVFKMDTERL
jgi:hypothetical protein